MRKLLAILAMLVVFGATPALAVTDGELDGDRHPQVGLMVAQDRKGEPLWRCSGTLIAPKLFLTAGHCTEPPAAKVQIWFDADVQSGIPANGYPYKGDVGGTPYTHPQYDPNAFWRHDLGVVVLKGAVKGVKYGKLPYLNQVNDYAASTKKPIFTAVGYGLQKAFPDAARWKDEDDRVRMVAYPKLIQINVPGSTGTESLILSNNTNTGGTCFGDSGGPNFIGRGANKLTIAGVTSFGKNGTCAGQGGVYRVDRPDDLNWLYGAFGKMLR